MTRRTRDGRASVAVLGRFAGFGVLAFVVLFVLSPMGCYISRAAYEEARILSRRTPIAEVINDSTTPSAERQKLRLVLRAREFAIDSLGLNPKESFTRYSRLDRDTLVLVVSAAYPDRLAQRTWWFPIVGRFPYKGFFNFESAHNTARELRAEGFDVSIGASSAFSTLGWFNDPLVSTTLRMDSVSLVNTVIHEIAHSTFFAKGQVVFNESFATFVGGRGAIEFFRTLGDSATLVRAEDEWNDDLVLGAFWASLYQSIDSAFAVYPDSLDPGGARANRMLARDSLYAAARRQLVDSVAPLLRTFPAGWPEQVVLNNSTLMARRVYATGLSDFDAVFSREGRSVARAVRVIVNAAQANQKQPFEALKSP